MMKILLAAVLLGLFSSANIWSDLAAHNTAIIGFALTLQSQSIESKPPSAAQSPEQERAAVGSPTRVWRYVIIGSAIVVFALAGVIAAFKLKRYIAGRKTYDS
ncbi:MAG: hypothetical protein WKF92_13340 [Pyrinomonadaceae bacterium]